MPNDYYVYVLFRADTGAPFYVGEGRGNRWLRHQRRHSKRNPYKNNVVQLSLGLIGDVPKVKVCENLDEETAYLYEIQWIEALGRWPEGPLLNATDGGEGVRGLLASERLPQILRMRELWLNPTWRENQLKVLKAGKANEVVSPETLALRNQRISKALTGKKRAPFSDSWRANISKASKGRVRTPEWRANLSAALKGKKKNPEQMERLAAQKRGVPLSEEHKAKLKAAHALRKAQRLALSEVTQ